MKLFRTLCMEEPEGLDTLDLEHDILRAVGDPSTKEVNWPKPPKKPDPVVLEETICGAWRKQKCGKDDVVLSFREYNDMLTKIYYLEHKNEWLKNVNKHLGEEIDSLQKQLLSRKLRKVRCICKLRGEC